VVLQVRPNGNPRATAPSSTESDFVRRCSGPSLPA
jgi:hypothetical protein